MGREILNKHIPKLTVQRGTSYLKDGKTITYGMIKLNDLGLANSIGKYVEIDIRVREYDADIINKEDKMKVYKNKGSKGTIKLEGDVN